MISAEPITMYSSIVDSISFPFMLGLITRPSLGWALGTVLGALSSGILPQAVQSAMGIALYAMFIALVVPAAKKAIPVLVVALIGIMISTVFSWVPVLQQFLSGGWLIMLATIVAAGIGALYFPQEGD